MWRWVFPSHLRLFHFYLEISLNLCSHDRDQPAPLDDAEAIFGNFSVSISVFLLNFLFGEILDLNLNFFFGDFKFLDLNFM